MSGSVTTPSLKSNMCIQGDTIVRIFANTTSPINNNSFDSPGNHKSIGGPVKRLFSQTEVVDNTNRYAGENPKKRQEFDEREKKITHEYQKTPTLAQLAAGRYADDFLHGGRTPPEEYIENIAPLIHQNTSATIAMAAIMEI
jgi:hypothetical protein